MPGLDQCASYVIKIEGLIDGDPNDWLGPVDIGSAAAGWDGDVTILSGIVTDQAGIVGLIRHIHGLGIALLAVERVANRSAEKSKEDEAQ